MEIDVKMKKEARKDLFWFFIFVGLPFISIIYSIAEFLYVNRI
ncbi:hypothetical protein OR571_05365 [Psychrobacillus sp. NEAU-3TGS]|nr:hypothetical protein [Psychrobacillus sp. NEAU-3TGS]MDI2586576.1 hypothetical protein [Psychrobacillus sp. NEAU-3TGS]